MWRLIMAGRPRGEFRRRVLLALASARLLSNVTSSRKVVPPNSSIANLRVQGPRAYAPWRGGCRAFCGGFSEELAGRLHGEWICRLTWLTTPVERLKLGTI